MTLKGGCAGSDKMQHVELQCWKAEYQCPGVMIAGRDANDDKDVEEANDAFAAPTEGIRPGGLGGVAAATFHEGDSVRDERITIPQ